MGRIAKLLSFARVLANGARVSDVKADPGGGANVTAQHFADPGDDSHPLPGDYVAMAGAAGSGRQNAVGYVDPLNAQKAQPGDKRIYGRDAKSGAHVVEVWLKNDSTATVVNSAGSFTLSPGGSIRGQNANGYFDLRADGTFEVNNVTISPAGLITTPVSIHTPSAIVNGVEVDQHDHPQGADSAGNTQVDTGPMK